MILCMATAPAIQAMRASKSKAQTPVSTVTTLKVSQEYFDASSEEHSSYSDYSSVDGPAKLVAPIGEDRDGEASDPDAEEGTPISEEVTGKTNKFERFPGLSRTRNKPRSFWARGTQQFKDMYKKCDQ
jgi:hypothetical protein